MIARTRCAILAALVLAAGCKEERSSAVAELSKVFSGEAERGGDREKWRAAGPGDRFRAGQAVRTSEDGSARLRFLAGSGLRMGPSTTIRFGPGKVAVEGELIAEEDAIIELEVGRAELTAGSRVKIDRTGNQIRFDVLVGSALVTSGQGATEVTAGQGLEVELGAARVERVKRRALEMDAGPVASAEDAGPPEADAGPAEAVAGAAVGEVIGKAARARAPGGDWAALPPGAHDLASGTEVTVPRGGRLLLRRGEEVAEVTGAAEVVVAPGSEDGALAEARRGRAELRATEADVTIRVPGGVIIARRGKGSGTRAGLAVDRRQSTVSVETGVVDVIGSKGGKEQLLLGQKGELARGGGLAVFGRPPSQADFPIDAGTSATIHDPAPPTDVRVRFATQCPAGGVLEVARGGSFGASRRRVPGESSAIVRLERGAHRYRIRCLVDGEVSEAASASGRLVVKKSPGTKPLPRRAPQNTVDTDGRLYTVLYQNLLPAITFRWPRAPEAARYRLVIEPARGKRIEATSKAPRHSMAAGKLDEGQYAYWFEAGEARSKKSTLRISFDNAAASGYLQAPKPGASWGAGERVEVAGAALDGWKVSVGGTALPLDRQHRFRTTVPRAAGDRGIAIEFRHPSRGVHLYVRRDGKR